MLGLLNIHMKMARFERNLSYHHSNLLQFGREISEGFSLTGEVVVADPIKSCEAAANGQNLWGKIVLVERGDCMFVGEFEF